MSKKPTEVSDMSQGKSRGKSKTPQDAAFRRWLEGQLHEKYDPVLEESIPDDLLSVLKQDDRPK